MEVAVAEVSENNEMASLPEAVKSPGDKKNASEKELLWEKIAAEIVADEEEIQPPMEVAAAEASSESETAQTSEIVEKTVEETVIKSVTEEKPTETESSEVVPEAQNESVSETSEEVAAQSAEIIKEGVVKETILNEEIVKDVVSEDVAPEETPDQALTHEEVAVPISETVELATPIEEPCELPKVADPIPADEVVESQEILDEEVVESADKLKETVEISEVKPDEAPEVADDLEYTVLEAEDVETHEIIEEHLAQTNKGVETVVIINPDHSQTEITIEQLDEDDRPDDGQPPFAEEVYVMSKSSEAVDDPGEVKEVKPKKQRGRKPIADIPLHVLGRDISKPSEGVSNGGRTMPKPRLGVKVPYRNLTSQIVSKQEIEKEIMERFKLKQEQSVTNSGDILFARKLTQRLAKKLIPDGKDGKERGGKGQAQEAGGSSLQKERGESDIKNNSDLIAILEGDGEDIELARQKKQTSQEEKKEQAKKTEKEIALEQLKELPGQKTVYKGRGEDEKRAPKEVRKGEHATPPVASPLKESKANIEKKSHVDLEPRLKTGMVIKTYTRKRKSTELEPVASPQPSPPKKTVVAAATVKNEDGTSNTVYVTKSSRVIKRKVIWDPDETPARAPPAKSPKLEAVKTPAPKASEKKDAAAAGGGANEKQAEKRASATPAKKVVAKAGTPGKKPKRLTEVDKLLMDEGAVNMIYDVKNNDDANPKKKNNKATISLDRAHKELMSKTNVIKNDLQQNTSKDMQKSLRKKEIVSPSSGKKEATPSPVTRKKSKDSARSSVHSPAASPSYNAAEASRIIRRHSSSSFSSDDELDDEEESDERERVPKKKSSAEAAAKKKAKKAAASVAGETKPSAKEATTPSPKNNNNTDAKAKETNHVDKAMGYKTFAATKRNKMGAIKLQSVEGKCFLNEQVLKDLISSLKEFGKDDDCHVVSITSDCVDSFCEGLDYRSLVVEDEGARKKKAGEVASLVKEFLRCLLNFPKVLVAGIQGECVGLGVTMLPLFDMVVASDTATFSTPYSKWGCVPEGGFLLTVPHLSNNGLASELLYASQVIKADDAFRRGLVSRLCWPEKYQQELKSLLTQVANQPIETLVETKQQQRHHIIQSTDSALSSVSKVLVEYWTSPECQKNFAK